jgi:3-deoxy-manno-octulosonate cytidylyltransferase (CMP-KDO synthetase)
MLNFKKFIKGIAVKLGLLNPALGVKISQKNKAEIILDYKKRYPHITTFVETGTFEGDMVVAMKNDFTRIFTVEFDNNLCDAARNRFKNDVATTVLCGDSAVLIKDILSEIHVPAIFWLDAHNGGDITSDNSPIIGELSSIIEHPVNGHVILIDDARHFDLRTIRMMRAIARKKKYTFFVESGLFILCPQSEKKLNIVGIIPARMGSTRFPGKPLAPILGMPMIGHVYFRSKMSSLFREVYIATCDKEIADYANSIGAKCVMTKDTHERASDRAAEATSAIEALTGDKIDIVVMIQGDEPMVRSEMIEMAVQPFLDDHSINVVNLMAPIKTEEEHNDLNCPKVVVRQDNNALYFSREPIPSKKKWNGGQIPMYKQVCVIPFRRDFLFTFNSLKPTPLEIIESIDMNRVLEHGFNVKMVLEEFETQCVDTQKDLEMVEKMLERDPLVNSYLKK